MPDDHDLNEADLKAFRLLEEHVDFTDPEGSEGIGDLEIDDPEIRRSLEEQLGGLRFLEQLLDPLFRNRHSDDKRTERPVSEGAPRVGRYYLLSELQQGGVGTVYRAVYKEGELNVVLKILPPHFKMDADRAERFRKAARRIAELKHGGISNVLDVDRAGEVWFYTTDLIEGHGLDTLLSMLDRIGAEQIGDTHIRILGTRLPGGVPESLPPAIKYVRHCAHLIAQVAQALASVHGQGMTHNNLKPSSLMINAEGNPVITDFVLASDMDAAELKQYFIDQPHFLPPEILEGTGKPGPSQDVYSLGVILYRLLTLRFPFEGCSLLEITRSIKAGEYAGPSRINPAVSGDIERVVCRAMHGNPDSRYRSAGEFARDLNGFVRD